MKYTNADFIRLMSAAESVGGEHLDETCAMDEIEYPMPDGKTRIEHTHGCEQETLFTIPYDPTETVLVPEPLLEDDPDRTTYTAADGTERQVQRSRKEKGPDGRERVLYEIVERGSEVDGGGTSFALPVRVCAVADNVGMWPRFQHAMRDKETG